MGIHLLFGFSVGQAVLVTLYDIQALATFLRVGLDIPWSLGYACYVESGPLSLGTSITSEKAPRVVKNSRPMTSLLRVIALGVVFCH